MYLALATLDLVYLHRSNLPGCLCVDSLAIVCCTGTSKTSKIACVLRSRRARDVAGHFPSWYLRYRASYLVWLSAICRKNMKFYFNFIAFTLFNSMMTHLFVSLTSGRLIFILDNSPSVKWQIIVINKSNLLSLLLWWMNIFFLEIYWNNKELMIESRLADIFIVNESMRRIRIYCRLGQYFWFVIFYYFANAYTISNAQ